MTNWLAKLTMISLKPRKPSFGQREQQSEERSIEKVSLFTNIKSLTFPILVALVKGSWESLQLLPITWAKSVWVPFCTCIIFGLLIAISNLKEEETLSKEKTLSYDKWIAGICIAILNSLVVFGSVIGASTGSK